MIQIAETASPGLCLQGLGSDLHCMKLVLPRTFYVNQKTAEGRLVRKFSKLLPRSDPVYNLNEYNVTETVFR